MFLEQAVWEDKREEKLVVLEQAFKKLREKWFYSQLEEKPQEQVWEDEEDGDLREARNQALKERFDKDTQRIIEGEDVLVAPCRFDYFRMNN